jgi:hypothetical protein
MAEYAVLVGQSFVQHLSAAAYMVSESFSNSPWAYVLGGIVVVWLIAGKSLRPR